MVKTFVALVTTLSTTLQSKNKNLVGPNKESH